jgi:hypothetical protein
MRPSIAGLVKLRASSREFVRTNQRGQVVSLPDSGIECSFMPQSGEHYFLRRGTSQKCPTLESDESDWNSKILSVSFKTANRKAFRVK